MSLYEVAILGNATPLERETLTATLRDMIGDFGLDVGEDVLVHDGGTIAGRDKRAAFAAIYFGGEPPGDVDAAQELVRSSAPIIPSLPEGADLADRLPGFLRSANASWRRRDDPGMVDAATAMLECVGLLRPQRRVFISYRRTDSRAAAHQLHDRLNARGFDVFLDTHDIRPGDPFQDVLWHRLVDSDVMVMLDTPAYFDSRWTRQELGRALAKDIQVLRVVWPGHSPSKLTNMAETVFLDSGALEGADGPIAVATADEIARKVERLRSRAIAARYMAITGKLRADAEKIGATVEGIGAHRAISLRLPDGRLIWAYPIVGVPTAEILHDVADKARRANMKDAPVLVYDHIGIRDAWSAHLRWLDEQISAVRALKVSEAGWALAAWED
ncbi:toll/interleukin-1 receptor domain-containing protein [Methylobacterium sp. 1030]|uniref:toll/interleukin-1 receptor domain-containing protein n=1 Tax=Methylobacterium sp. 1030 TaxID=3156404 RepID=UPI003399DB5D